jgi:hypothetical protein
LPKKGPDPFFKGAAALGLGLMLVVVLAAAAIRLGSASGFFLQNESLLGQVRAVHRVAASLEVLAAVWLAWLAWRGRRERPWLVGAAGVVLVLTLFLAILGIVGGQTPPRGIALGNLLGGLALTALFAWFLGALRPDIRHAGRPVVLAAGLLLALQLFIGARLAIFERYGVALPVHGLLAMALAAFLAWAALARVGGVPGKVLFVLALAAPLAGFTALQYEYSAVAAFVHALAAAALLSATAIILGRNA